MAKTAVYIDLSRLCLTTFTTGIQRVAKSIVLRMLQNPDLDVTLLAECPNHIQWRVLDPDAFAAYYTEQTGSPYGTQQPRILSPQDIPTFAIFFDIDSAWNMNMARAWLYPLLKQRGVTVVAHVYDIIPVTHPHFFHEQTMRQFLTWISMVLRYADHIICNAHATKNAIATLCKSLQLTPPPTAVVPLGADFARKTSAEEPDRELLAKLPKHRYVLMVGTIEPRKNHALLLDAVERLATINVRVVFAGRIGWNMEEFRKRMENHPENGKWFFFANSPTDATIRELYANALAVVFPTQNEGFGLPIVEAFLHGTPVLASDLPVLREVGGSYADYFDQTSVDALVSAVQALVTDPNAYQEKRAKIAAFTPTTWDDCTDQMMQALCEMGQIQGQALDCPIRQMLVLSARNEDLLRALPSWDACMPFIEEVLVCCPERNVAELQAKWQGRVQLKFFTDEQLLAGESLPEDHITRNLFLRCLILRKAPLDELFVMCDDDYRPLYPLTEEVFRTQGRYRAYYCYDLCEWKGTQGNYTSYDLGQFRTRDFLLGEQMPTLQYSSHQPQVIERKLYCELLDAYPGIERKGLGEWSIYFNYGLKHYPQKFLAEPYCTIAWPGAHTDWTLWCKPKHYCFENFYDVLYTAGHVFEGMHTEYHADTAIAESIEKIARWERELQRQTVAHAANEMAEQVYRNLYGVLPEYALEGQGDALQFRVPQIAYIPTGTVLRLPLAIADDKRNGTLRWGITDAKGQWLVPQQELELTAVDAGVNPELVLPIPAHAHKGTLLLEYQVGVLQKPITAAVPCIFCKVESQ